jgi:hypothetical protein
MRLLFILLLGYSAASGQTIFSGKDGSVIKLIDDLPASEPFDTAHAYRKVNSPYVYIISDKDMYDNFGWPTPEKYWEFNFKDYHILGIFECRQCLEFCHHEEGQTNCHRNRCNEEWIWLMRDNKKAFTEIPVKTMPGHEGNDLPLTFHKFFGDTIIKMIADTSIAQWYTTGQGDCMVHFTYGLFTDNYHPVLLLKEWNHWGGCRAGGAKASTISFTMPPGILYHKKNTILREKTGY